jgi:hypothetical protein
MVKRRKDANISDRDISGQLHQDRRANKEQPKVERNMPLRLHHGKDAPAFDELTGSHSDRAPSPHFQHIEDMRHRLSPLKVTDYELEHPTVKTVQWKQAKGGGITHTQEDGERLIGAGFDRRPRKHVCTDQDNRDISGGGLVDHETKIPTYHSPGVNQVAQTRRG